MMVLVLDMNFQNKKDWTEALIKEEHTEFNLNSRL